MRSALSAPPGSPCAPPTAALEAVVAPMLIESQLLALRLGAPLAASLDSALRHLEEVRQPQRRSRRGDWSSRCRSTARPDRAARERQRHRVRSRPAELRPCCPETTPALDRT